MKKIGVFVMVIAMACLFEGVASAEMHVDASHGEALGDNIGQTTTAKELPGTGENNVTQFRHLENFPLTSLPHDPPEETEFKPFKQAEEPLLEPEFM